MNPAEYKKKIKALQNSVLQDITNTAQQAGFFHFVYDPDNPTVNTCLRFYNGNKYPEKLAVEAMYINDDNVLEFFTGEDGRRFTIDKMHSADIDTLNRGVEMVQSCNTPRRFAALLNKLSSFPIVLYSIMDRNGWYDLTDQEEDTGNICWCPKEKILITEENFTGKAITVRLKEYKSLELDWHHAEEWFRQADFKTLERISGYKQFDFSDEDGYQDFVDAVHRWWASLENKFPNNGKYEKIRIWKENK